MDTITTITLRFLLQNKKRTILTILTVIMSIGMLTAVLCGGYSLIRFLRDKEADYSGNYAYCIELPNSRQIKKLENGENIKEISLYRYAGSAFYGEHTNHSRLAIAEIDNVFARNFYLDQCLIIGRLPENDSEIVLSQDFISTNEIDMTVGDSISLQLGIRIFDEINTELTGLVNYLGDRESFHPSETKEYTVVGIIRNTGDSKITATYNAFSGLGDEDMPMVAYITPARYDNGIYEEMQTNASTVKGNIAGINSSLLLYNGVTASNGGKLALAAVIVGILILAIACGIMISNALSISLQERIKQVGMLSSIGATPAQKRMSVLVEAFFIGVVGIPLGMVFGIAISAIILVGIRHAFSASFFLETVHLSLHLHWCIIMAIALSGIISLSIACMVPGKRAAWASVIDVLKQTDVYHIKRGSIRKGRLFALLFGVCGALASKNIHRNPKRFAAIIGSIILATTLGLSMFSFSEFMLLQAKMDMKPDGTSYTDVIAQVKKQDIPSVVKAISDAGLSADISYRISTYMTIHVDSSQINPKMSEYFYGGNIAELYVVGLDESNFIKFCQENNIESSEYIEKKNRGVLINCATGDYSENAGRIVIDSPFLMNDGYSVELHSSSDWVSTIVIPDVLNDNVVDIQGQFVRDRAVLIVPLSDLGSMVSDDTYYELYIDSVQHEEVTKCIADAGFYFVNDIAAATENTRQIATIFKITVVIFVAFMIMIVGLNICNTVANTIDARKKEFAMLQSMGMTIGSIRKMLVLESLLYGIHSLVIAIPISLMIHCGLYLTISKNMTPFVFYIEPMQYVIAVMIVTFTILGTMIFSMQQIDRVNIVSELKMDNI